MGKSVLPEELSTPAVSDVLDAGGLRGAVLDGLELVAAGRAGAVGRARTATVVATTEPGIPGLAEVLDDLGEGDALVLGWRAPGPASVFGGLAAHRAALRGCRAVIVAGWVRDVGDLESGPLTVWARGRTPRSGKTRLALAGVGEPAVVQDVTIAPGDLVVADRTGVVVVASEDAVAAMTAAQEQERLDLVFEQALRAGADFGTAYQDTGTM